MADRVEDALLQQINQNLGIAHKICGLYFTDPDDREDVLQEMMYQVCRSHKRFDGRSKFSTWMYRVCLNTAITFKRRDKKRLHEHLSKTHHQIADAPVSNQHEVITMLLESIATLSAVNKAIMLLYLENMSYEEIASITGLSKSNVGVRLVRIKKDLEIIMKEKIKSIEDVNP